MSESQNGQAQAKNGLARINRIRTWAADLRKRINEDIADFNRQLDEEEVLITKTPNSLPPKEDPIIDADVILSGHPDRS